MKTKYPIRLFSGLLLSSALFFTSCTKEELQVPQPAKANPENPVHAASADQTVTVMKLIPYWKSVNGLSLKAPALVTFCAQVVSGPEKTAIDGVLYRESYGTLVQLASIGSVYVPYYGYHSLALSTIVAANTPYYFRVSCKDEVCWVPDIGVNQSCYIIFPKAGITVWVIFF